VVIGVRQNTELGLSKVIYQLEIPDLWDFVSSTFNSKSAIKLVDITAISLSAVLFRNNPTDGSTVTNHAQCTELRT
jgi:hypothetical protein